MGAVLEPIEDIEGQSSSLLLLVGIQGEEGSVYKDRELGHASQKYGSEILFCTAWQERALQITQLRNKSLISIYSLFSISAAVHSGLFG